MQNRVYLQRIRNTLNKNKAISNQTVLNLLKKDQDIKYGRGALSDLDLGYPGAAVQYIDDEAYQLFLNDYMNAMGNRMGIYPDGPSFSDPDIPHNYY